MFIYHVMKITKCILLFGDFFLYIHCDRCQKIRMDWTGHFFFERGCRWFILFSCRNPLVLLHTHPFVNTKKNTWAIWTTFLSEQLFVDFISSPDPKGHVSYCHHLASVVRRKLFQKSSLKVQDQWKPNLVWIITRVSSFKIVSGDAVHQPTQTQFWN